MLVLKSTMDKKVKRLQGEIERAGKYIVDMANDFEKEKNRLNEEIEKLRQNQLNQEWYRETWSEMVLKQNEIMQEQSNALQQIADATWNKNGG